jgi:uncharacterized coiled-coil protein SlyX
MNIEDMTIEQLKALAYDQIISLEQTKQNLVILQNKINELQNKEIK